MGLKCGTDMEIECGTDMGKQDRDELLFRRSMEHPFIFQT